MAMEGGLWLSLGEEGGIIRREMVNRIGGLASPLKGKSVNAKAEYRVKCLQAQSTAVEETLRDPYHVTTCKLIEC